MKRRSTTFGLAGVLLLLATQSPHAQTAESYVWQSVAIRGGGFVPGLVFSTVEQNVLYARTDMAGAYRWDETKYGWIPIMDWLTRPDMKYIGVESIAADPVDSNVVYMAVGTYVGSNGQIIRSADRGNTWTRYNIATSMGGNADGRSMGERLMVDPNNTSILYFGSRTAGLWKSTDSAATWAKVASFPVTGTNPYGLSFVVFDKTSGTAGNGSSTIYVGVAATTAGTNLYRSADAGATWTLVTGTNPPSGMMPHHGVLASDGNLWIAYNSSSGPNSISSGSVWKLNTATSAWTNVNPAGHGGGIGGISVSASDPNYALASTLDWWAPDEMYRTTDGGTSWTGIGRNATHNMNGAEYLCFGPPNCTTPSSAGWAGDIEIDPFNQSRAFYVTGQGVWSSKNSDAASGIVWSFEDKDLEETVGLDLTSSVKTAVFAVVGDIGIIRTATDALDTPSPNGMVTNPKFGNGNSVDFAGLNPNIVADCGTGSPSGGYSSRQWCYMEAFCQPGRRLKGSGGGRWLSFCVGPEVFNRQRRHLERLFRPAIRRQGGLRSCQSEEVLCIFGRNPLRKYRRRRNLYRSHHGSVGQRPCRRGFRNGGGSLGGGREQFVPLKEFWSERDQGCGTFAGVFGRFRHGCHGQHLPRRVYHRHRQQRFRSLSLD